MAPKNKTSVSHVSKTKMLFATLALALSSGAALIAIPTISNSKYSCTDSDGGKKSGIRGFLTITEKLTKKKKIVDDFCASRTVVMEGYCDATNKNAFGQVGMKCGKSAFCSKGACVPLSAPLSAPAPVAKAVIFTKSATSPSGTFVPGAAGVLAKFEAKPTGEGVQLRKIGLGIVSNNPRVLSGTVLVKVNGTTVVSVAASTLANSTTNLTQLALSTFTNLPVNQTATITVEGTISSLAPSGSMITVFMDLTQVKRITSGTILDPGVAITMGNPLAIQLAALQVHSHISGGSQNVAAGSLNVPLAVLELNAGSVSSGEDVKVTSVTITDTRTNGGSLSDITNLILYDETGAPVSLLPTLGTTNVFRLPNNFIVTKGGSRTLTLKGAIANSGSGSHNFAVKASRDVIALGTISGNSVTPTIGTAVGFTVTISSSGLLTAVPIVTTNVAPTLDRTANIESSLPVMAFTLTGQNEILKIRSLKLKAVGKVNEADLRNIRLFYGSTTTPFASAERMFAESSSTLSVTFTAFDNLLPSPLQPGDTVSIYVQTDTGFAGQVRLGDSFQFSLDASDVEVIGAASGSSLPLSAKRGFPIRPAGVSHIVPFTVMVMGDAPASGSSVTQAVLSNTQLGRVKVTNYGGARIMMNKLFFTDNGFHSSSAMTYKLWYSDMNTTNYTQNPAVLSQSRPQFTTGFSIDGGAYRFASVGVDSASGLATGDTFQLSVQKLGDFTYSAQEIDLGYDGNGNGRLTDTITGLYAEGKPNLGTISKQ